MRKISLILITILISVFALSGFAVAESKSVAKYTFKHKKAKAQWSARKTVKIGENRCLGLFNDRNKRYPSEAVLTLEDIPEKDDLQLSFQVYFVGSWDSEGKLADRFEVSLEDGPTLLDMTSFPCTLNENDDTNPVDHDGFIKVGERDRPYWTTFIELRIQRERITGKKLKIKFKGFLTGRKTEFWALDNVAVDSVKPFGQ